MLFLVLRLASCIFNHPTPTQSSYSPKGGGLDLVNFICYIKLLVMR